MSTADPTPYALVVAQQHLRQGVESAKSAGMTRADIIEVIEQVFGVRRVNGYEVTPGWTMPECPPEIAGARLMAEAHGSDGFEIYWWHNDWGDLYRAGSGRSARAMRVAGLEPFDSCLNGADPLVAPDAHDPECLEAYRLLGFLT